jgi:hypothetical protein
MRGAASPATTRCPISTRPASAAQSGVGVAAPGLRRDWGNGAQRAWGRHAIGRIRSCRPDRRGCCPPSALPPDWARRWAGRDDDDGFLAAAAQNAGQRLGVARVDLLVRHERRNVDEIAGACLRGEFQAITPLHPRPARDDIDHALDGAMMVRTGLRFRMDHDGACPEPFRTGARLRDRGGAVHSGRLRRVGVEFAGADDAHAVVPPGRCRGHGNSLLFAFDGHSTQSRSSALRMTTANSSTRQGKPDVLALQPRIRNGVFSGGASSVSGDARRICSSDCARYDV